jgi:general secretion pathway protein I
MKPGRECGFTLIEMVVAFAILGLTLTALYGSFEAALSRTHRDARLSEGTLIAQSLLARAGADWPLTAGTLEGDFGGYTYTLVTTEVPAPSRERPFTLPTFAILATVSWPGFSGQRSISLSTLKLAPKLEP